MLILGIDPGKTGALALIETKDALMRMSIEDMPSSAQLICKWLQGAPYPIDFAVIEDVGAGVFSPNGRKQGAVSAFTFGYGAGVLEGILTAMGNRIYKVKPAVWKASMGLSRDKADSLKMAREKFPAYEDSFKLKKHDGRAEAALIALFGLKHFK